MHKYTDISQQIKKYLDGELDARAMHELERRAQDDPFLMDALEGFQSTPVNLDAGMSGISNRLQQRTTQKEVRITPWRTMGIAASILILLGLGLFWYNERAVSPVLEKNVAAAPAQAPKAEPSQSADTGATSINKEAKIAASNKPADKKTDLIADITHRRKAALPAAATMLAESAPPAASNISPAQTANAFQANASIQSTYKSADTTTPLNEMIVMQYSAQEKPNARLTDKVADSAFRSSNSFIAKVRTDTSKLREVRIKGTDIAKLDNSQNNYLNNAQNPDVAAKDMLNYQPKSLPANAAMVVAQPVTGLQASGVMHSYLAKRPSAGGIMPLNPVKLHGRILKGMVKDSGAPVPYATVKIKGTTISTLTDAKGSFTLYTVPDSAILQVSAEGFAVKETKVTKRDLQLISIHPAAGTSVDAGNAQGNEINSSTYIGARPSTGWDDFDAYLRENAISTDGKTGTVKLSFTVNPDNSLSNFKVIKGVSAQTDNAAVKLIKDGAQWYSSPDDKAETVTVNVKFHARSK